MAAFANPVISIDSPDAAWRRKTTAEKLAIEDAIMKDRGLNGGMAKLYHVLFRHAWSSRRVKGTEALQVRLAAAAGQPVTTMRRNLRALRGCGFVAARRFAYVTEWIIAPTPAELAADPVRRRYRQKPTPQKLLRARHKGRFCRRSDGETDCPLVEIQTPHEWTISSPQIVDSKDHKTASSSNNEKSENSFRKTTGIADDDHAGSRPTPQEPPPVAGIQNQNPSVEEQKPTAKPPLVQFLDWFEDKWPETSGPSLRDVQEIENWLAPYSVTWRDFTEACKRRCKGGSTNPVGLVKNIAKAWPQRTQPPRVVTMPPTHDWNKRCPTCKSRAGLLPDGTPCPECQLGRDLARANSRK